MTVNGLRGRHRVTLTPTRSAIARRMTQSKQQAPHFYVATDMEMDSVLSAADELNRDRADGERITITAFLIRALAVALAGNRRLNAVWNQDTLELVDSINVGVAIALDDGLIAPAILGCENLDLWATASALRDLIARTKTGRLRASEIADATFTLTNLGMFEVAAFAAIITPPQVATLATGRVQQHPAVRGGAIVARSLMTATVSADHRAVDGADVARFLGDLKAVLEQPDTLMRRVDSP